MDHKEMSRKRKSVSPARDQRDYRSGGGGGGDRQADHYRNRDAAARGPPAYRDGNSHHSGGSHLQSHHQQNGTQNTDGAPRSQSVHRDGNSHHSGGSHHHGHHQQNGPQNQDGTARVSSTHRDGTSHQQTVGNHHAQQQNSLPSSQPPRPAPAAAAANPPVSTGPTNYDKYKSLSDIKYPYMTDFGEYERQTKIGQGTFGEVFKAKCKKTGRQVALKKILMENEKEGFPITALREIKILQQFDDPNVVKLFDICSSKASDFNRYRSTFYLVFEFCEHDLAGLLSNTKVKFSHGEVKTIMKQLLEGLFYIHAGKVLHRDMKTSNILLNKEGILKIADFGLARSFSQMGTKEKPNRFTNRVVTLWYRPPELLLGDRNYTPAIDVWGAACIMCELWTRSPILQGQNEQHQLTLIITLCGSITPEVYPDVAHLELYKTLDLQKDVVRDLKGKLGRHIQDKLALDLIDKLFTLNPGARPDCDAALNHDYFWSDPMPQPLANRMKSLTMSNFEYTANTHRQQQQQQQQPANQAGNRASSQVPGQHGGPPGAAGGFFRDRVF
ncbi:Cyclin-dependent kinase 9 [Hypsibius exemplaris]|uniref:Cyclin-dependent kinase 9 n=1 Tax=Hypsibius exemplaris TaxID=2072580 RepID=A0A1W0WN88_HYPEX|nr:Cyclin-dependent kinase 9 [Hypsibius exemplaris]